MTRIFEFRTVDTLLNVYPLGELDASLLTTWVGGSAYHIRGFAYVEDRVRQVIDATSRGMPELMIDDEEQESILVTHKEIINGEWKRTSAAVTDIYKWSRQSYEKVASVPWAERFQYATKSPGGVRH